MQIIEVRNDIFKLAYSPYQNGILLSDFLLVSEGNKSVLAQVINIESSKERDINIAALKGCLSVDETGKISPYIGYIPSTGAEVMPVTPSQVISMLSDNQETIFWGYLAQHDNVMFRTESKFLEKKPLVLMDDYNNYNVIVNNFVHMSRTLRKKIVIVDFDGNLQVDNAFYVKVGEDLRLPLSFNTLNYIYENDLKNESLSTQAVVQDIIIELQDYIRTLPEGFLPFSTIKRVVYSQYEENKIPELMLFKNKFVKYSQQDFLAENADDFNFLNDSIAENPVTIIDASEMDRKWHKLLLNYLAKELGENVFFVAKLENDNSDKQTILDIYNNKVIMPILVSSYTHHSLNVLKSIAENLVLFPPNSLIDDFGTYTAFMQKLNRDEYVICGENTLYLSFIVRLTYTDTNMSPEYIEKEIQADVDKLYRAGAKKAREQEAVAQRATVPVSAPQQPQPQPQPQRYVEEPALSVQTMEPVIAQETQNYNEPQQFAVEDEITDDDLDFLDEMDNAAEPDELEQIEDESTQEYEAEDVSDDAEIEYLDDEIEQEAEEVYEADSEENSVEEEYFEDDTEVSETYEEVNEVDDEEEYNENDYEEAMEEVEEEEELQEDVEEEPEEEFEDEEVNQAPPIPIYSVPDVEVEEKIEFTEGNFVFHEVYGRGVIEKIMNYGSKTLCSIQFEEVGRRLLDPNLAGLKQV